MTKIGLDDFLVQAEPFYMETFRGCQRVALDDPTLKETAAWFQGWERRQRDEKGLVRELAEEILRTDHFAQDAGGQLNVFERGCYRSHGCEFVARSIKRLLVQDNNAKRWSRHLVEEVAEFLRVDAPRLWERPSQDLVNIRNGLLDVRAGVLRPHDPAYLSSVQLPVTFNPTATCSRWDTFLSQVLPGDCRTLLFEILATVIRGDISDQQAVLLVGEGSNGKSTLLRVVLSFLGQENVSGVPLHRLETDKFVAARLLGKLANICADLPAEHLSGTSIFKALTGGDRLIGERKFQSSFEFVSFARLLFSANSYPQSKDASHAFFRRWLVIPFDTAIDPRDRNPALAEELARPEELSGVLNRALAVLPDVIRRRGFSQSETTRLALMEFREMTDPLAAWLDRCTRVQSEGFVSRKDLTIAYNAQAEASGRPPMTVKALCQAVRRLRPTVKDAQRSVCGQVQWVFLGIVLQDLSNLPSRDSHDSHDFSTPLQTEVGGDGDSRSHHSHDSYLFSQISSFGEEKERKEGEDIKIENGVNAVNAVNGSSEPCWTCGSTKRWRSIYGVTLCPVCHPPANSAVVESLG